MRNLSLTPEEIMQGQKRLDELNETPQSFSNERNLQKNNTRMAGQMGERALTLMSNPMEAEMTTRWMDMFAQSNEGMQFNQAKMDRNAMGLV